MPESLYDLPELVTLPGWADPEMLAKASAFGLVVLLLATFLILRFLRRVVVKVVLVAVIVLLGAGLWNQRLELRSCADECSCTLFGQTVQIPLDRNPRCGSG
ncbi:MAG: hypothetical protein H8E59_05960 [Actinobacteria bacterium]|nr:hypothetical protein [Actinomycetota bacterium]